MLRAARRARMAARRSRIAAVFTGLRVTLVDGDASDRSDQRDRGRERKEARKAGLELGDEAHAKDDSKSLRLYSTRMALRPRWSSPQIAGASALAAHFPALANKLLRDDVAAIHDNVDLRSLAGLARGLRHAADLADSDPGASPIVRPLSAAFEWLVWEILRAGPIAQHAVSVALHALVAMTLARVLVAHRISQRAAVVAAILFAVHPVTAAAVADLSSRSIVVATLALLYGVTRAGDAKSARTVAAWSAFAVFASGIAHEAFILLAVPLVLAGASERRARMIGAGIGAIAAAAIVIASLPAISEVIRTGAAMALHDLFVVVVAPASSSYFTPPAIAMPIAAAVIVAVLALAAWIARKHDAHAAAGCALVVLGPLAFAPAAVRGGLASDRQAYVVLLGVVIAGAFAATRVALPSSSRLIALAPYAIAAALVPFTWVHVAAWRDEHTRLHALADDRPTDPEGELAAALLASEKEAHADAYPVCAEYASQRPRSTRAHLCVGTALLAAGDPQGAIVFLGPYTEQHPDEERARHSLATALFATNALAELQTRVARWRVSYPKAPDVEAARVELARRGFQ